jgi:hypothetical protein
MILFFFLYVFFSLTLASTGLQIIETVEWQGEYLGGDDITSVSELNPLKQNPGEEGRRVRVGVCGCVNMYYNCVNM